MFLGLVARLFAFIIFSKKGVSPVIRGTLWLSPTQIIDACLVEHKEHPNEVPLLLQWHLQLLLANDQACLFQMCSISSDQVPHLCFPLRITTTITILTPSGGNSRHL
jgi:hypothetical protein